VLAYGCRRGILPTIRRTGIPRAALGPDWAMGTLQRFSEWGYRSESRFRRGR
jgi:hypothetical protein